MTHHAQDGRLANTGQPRQPDAALCGRRLRVEALRAQVEHHAYVIDSDDVAARIISGAVKPPRTGGQAD